MPAKKKTQPRAKARKTRKAPQPPAFSPGMAPECLMCPFGLFFFTMRNTRPDVMEHLTAAGQELFLAFKALVDQAAERWEQTGKLQRIPVR